MVRKSNFIVEGKCFIPIQINSEVYEQLVIRINNYFCRKGYNQIFFEFPFYKHTLLQQTFHWGILDEGTFLLKMKKTFQLISKSQYEQEIYFQTLRKLTDEVPFNISYSIVPAKKKNISGCIIKIRSQPAIIFKMKQIYPHLKVDESHYEDIIDSNKDFISEFIDSFAFETIEMPYAINHYLHNKMSTNELITVSPSCFKVPSRDIQPESVAVMMPFKQEYDNVYDTIKETCRKYGFECHRADDFWNDSMIIQDIFELIYCSLIVIVDFSEKNPNVFYEAGIAHTLGRNVIPITQSIEDIPFDLNHHRHIDYTNNEEGLEKLKMKLEKRLHYLKNNQVVEN